MFALLVLREKAAEPSLESAQDRILQFRPRQHGSFPSVLEIIIRSLPVDPMDSATLLPGLGVQDICQILITDSFNGTVFLGRNLVC